MKIKTHWFRHTPNFGDQLTPLLLNHFGYEAEWAEISDAELLCIGSYLEHVPEDYSGVILGTGCISYRTEKRFPRAEILAVRGPLTERALGLSDTVWGDPGLLAESLVCQRGEKAYVIGFLPHYADKDNAAIRAIVDANPDDCCIIDVQHDPINVLYAINACECVLSSSLHGLIAAESLGIPSRWIYAPGLQGGRFKFDDYFESADYSEDTPVVLYGEETVDELHSLAELALFNSQRHNIKKELRSQFERIGDLIEERRGGGL